jgi:hypothetical protein
MPERRLLIKTFRLFTRKKSMIFTWLDKLYIGGCITIYCLWISLHKQVMLQGKDITKNEKRPGPGKTQMPALSYSYPAITRSRL